MSESIQDQLQLIRAKMGDCPYCGKSSGTGYDQIEVNDGYAMQIGYCCECESRWAEHYEMVRVERL